MIKEIHINYKLILRILLTIILIFFLYRSIDITNVLIAIKDINYSVIILAFIFNYFGSITMQSLITKKSSNTFNVSIWKLDKVNLSMRFYAMILPMAAVSIIRWNRYTLLGCSKSHSLLLMLQNKILQMLFITFFFFVSFFVYSDIFSVKFDELYFPLFILIVLSLFTFLYFLGLITGTFRSYIFFKYLTVLAFNFPRKISKKILKIIFKIKSSIQNDHKISGKKILLLLGLSLSSHTLILISQYYSSYALNMGLTFLELAFARSFVQLLLMLPLTVAGIGVREIGFVSTLALFNVNAEMAIALSLVLLGFQICFALLGAFTESIFIIQRKQII